MAAMSPHFTLHVATSADGFIARTEGHAPSEWASPEEQSLFLSAIDGADWSVMGRKTHIAADRPDRRRIVFSARQTPGWFRPSQLRLDPGNLRPSDLAARVGHIRPLVTGLILGGTRVHDWFLGHRAIDAVQLTVEPLEFGTGLPVFAGQDGTDPVKIFRQRGFRVETETILNPRGTRYIRLLPGA